MHFTRRKLIKLSVVVMSTCSSVFEDDAGSFIRFSFLSFFKNYFMLYLRKTIGSAAYLIVRPITLPEAVLKSEDKI